MTSLKLGSEVVKNVLSVLVLTLESMSSVAEGDVDDDGTSDAVETHPGSVVDSSDIDGDGPSDGDVTKSPGSILVVVESYESETLLALPNEDGETETER